MSEGKTQSNFVCEIIHFSSTTNISTLILHLQCRLIGLCLLQNELFPLFLQRHVLKYILGRPIRFHDLAFFDPIVYESMRQLISESTKSSVNILASLELNFV